MREIGAGYVHCGCRDCFAITIGDQGDFCSDCEEAGCEPDHECCAPGAYGADDDSIGYALTDERAQHYAGKRCPGCGALDSEHIEDNGETGAHKSYLHAIPTCGLQWDAIDYTEGQ